MAHFNQEWNQLVGTIPASGSLSQVMDTAGWSVHGLMLRPSSGVGTLVAGTVQFRVGIDSGTLYPLVDSTNARVGLPYATTGVAYSWVALQAIRPYRYVVIETSVVQTQQCDVVLPLKSVSA